MNKSVLVIDTPETCLDCRFCRELHEGTEACCELCDEPDNRDMCRIIDADYCQEKPEWCTLKELPGQKPFKAMREWLNFNCGWNACINEILKERDTQ